MRKLSQPNQPSEDEVLKWIKAYQETQDDAAQINLIVHYRNLVESIARKYSKGKNFHEDMAQVGMIGLLGAIRRYDATFGKNFEAFAIPTIIGEIKRFLRDKTWSVHVPRHIKELGPKIKATVELLTTDLQRSPEISEIAAHLEVSDEDIREAVEMGRSYRALSVDHSIEAGSGGSTVTLLDLVGSMDDNYEKTDQRLVLDKVLHVLSEREKKIIQYTYLENLSQKAAGEQLGISQMHVSRLQCRAIKKLRDAIRQENEQHEELD